MKYIKLPLPILSALAFLLVGCDSTRIVSTYESPEMEDTYSGIYVVGIAGDAMPEERMEDNLVRELEEEGYVAAADATSFEPEMNLSQEKREEIEEKLEGQGFDGILTFSLVSIEEEADYVAGAYPMGYYPSGYAYYDSYWGYYGHYAPLAYTPGYYTSNTIYHMEANLYDLETGELVWAARSETVEPATIYTFSENFAETVAEEMEEEGIIVGQDMAYQ
mgnify:CR=1 FL=1